MARPAPPSLAFQDDQALMGPNQAALLDRIKRSGGRDIRMNVIYGRLKAEGFGAYDQLVNAARARGLRPQVTLMATPEYSPQWNQTLNSRHNDPREWQRFAGEVAGHFKGRVGRYSIGNEMNLGGFFRANDKGARAGGRAYRGVYRAGYAGVRAADHAAQVLMGELVGGAPDTREFLRGVLGGKPLRTAGLAIHPYDAWITGGQAAQRNAWDINNLPDLQATLARYAKQKRLQTAQGRAAPLYLTEMGYFRGGQLSDAERTNLMAAAYRKAKAAGARQFLSYQMMPTVRRTVQDAPTVDPYGAMRPGATRTAPGWVWDTSLDPGALAGALRPRKASARAAKARKRGK